MEVSKREESIVIVILTLNQKESTLNCLASLERISDPAFEVIVADNGSTDRTVETVREKFPWVEVHSFPHNLGVASGRNRAAELAIRRFGASFLLFLDNDMVVEPDFVSALHEPFTNDKEVGQTQAKLLLLDDPQRLNDGGGCQLDFWRGQTVPVGFNEIDRGQYDTTRDCIACGGAMMVRAEVFEELGGFDEVFGPFGPEDLDFSLRLSDAGYQALFVPDAVAYHAVSHTIGAGYDPEYALSKSRHWVILMNRHASFHEKVLFWILGAPYRGIRAALREARRRNFKSFLALLKGALDHRSSDSGNQSVDRESC